MIAHVGDESEHSSSDRTHLRMEQIVMKSRHLWVERDAADNVVALSESRQVLEETDDEYPVIVRHQTHGAP
jgi:hypothetical protein